jgi:hypothetical protein
MGDWRYGTFMIYAGMGVRFISFLSFLFLFFFVYVIPPITFLWSSMSAFLLSAFFLFFFQSYHNLFCEDICSIHWHRRRRFLLVRHVAGRESLTLIYRFFPQYLLLHTVKDVIMFLRLLLVHHVVWLNWTRQVFAGVYLRCNNSRGFFLNAT